MAKGDVRPIKSSYRGGSWGGSSTYTYDDEGRGKSKSAWEWFEQNYTASNFSRDWLMSLDDVRCHWLLKSSTYRFGIMDIAYRHDASLDSRAKRLVEKQDSEKTWLEFHIHLVAGYNNHKDATEKAYQENAKRQAGEWAAYQAQRDAEQVKLDRDDYEAIAETVTVTAGMISSDLNQTFVSKDRVSDSGDWLEETADTYINGTGFGYEDQQATGVKLQITLSLDLSNSMIYNGLGKAAADTYRDLGMALLALKQEYPDDLYVGLFTFSEDQGSEPSNYGKYATVLHDHTDQKKDLNFRELAPYRPSQLKERRDLSSIFRGSDTWIYPLLLELEVWEKHNSVPGAVRLDLIITDAVLEHPMDIRKADEIQERRDGSLQTVLLNFLAEKDWVNGTLPKRCYQMPVDRDNVAGILRTVLSEFIGAHR